MTTIDYPWQRVLLHARCICRRPRNARFHLQGIAREIPLPKQDPETSLTRSDVFLLVFSALAATASQVTAWLYM